MKKSRPSINESLRRKLLIEAGYRCSIPQCNHESGLDIHHIDSNPTNNDENNLIILCAVHHRMTTEGKIDKKACLQLKLLLTISDKGGNLSTRREYYAAATKLLKSTNSYRAIAAGPFFVRPDWLMKRRDTIIQSPNYDRSLYNFVEANCSQRNHDIRFIFRNSMRFRQKIDDLILPEERTLFIDDILQSIDSIWGENGDKGPDLICHDTGFLRIELICDSALIETNRIGPDKQITSGTIYSAPTFIRSAQSRYDNVFACLSRGQAQELNDLRDFVKKLWINS